MADGAVALPAAAAAQQPPSRAASGAAGALHGGERRERKKRQTREALARAGLELFVAKGYENTAVREVTDAVDVSERTFFRYFASKEDLALSFVRDWNDAMLRALAARPAGEAPLVAVREAFRESFRQLAAADPDDPDAVPTYLLVVKLIDSAPALLAAHLRSLHDRDDELVGALAAREGVDPRADRRPRVLAAVFGSLVFLANKELRDAVGDASVADMLAAFDAYAGQLGPALSGHWR